MPVESGDTEPVDAAIERPELQALIEQLSDRANAVEPHRFLSDRHQAESPGMYVWWGDQEACDVLGAELGVPLASMLYVGQAGATKWPSGRRSSATLASRIGRQHIRGNARSSTFRRTISALLLDQLTLTTAGGGRLDRPSNGRVSSWIDDHLAVGIAPVDDRDTLGHVEQLVLEHLDPPLNLGQCVPSESRARLTQLRSGLDR